MPSSLIRWSGFALILGGILYVLLSYLTPSESTFVLLGLASVVTTTLVLVGLIGVHSLQASQSGKLGLAAIMTIALASIASAAMQIGFFFFPISVPSTLVLGIAGLSILGFVLLGISMNRAAVFPRHSGTGLIITSLLIIVAGRLILGIFLVGLGYRIFAGKVMNPSLT